MGLDMFLEKETYIGNNYKDPADQIKIDVDGVDQSKVTSVNERVACWRKANAIHKWFVENVQNGIDDCRRYPVSTDQLQELLDLVKEVLKHKGKALDKLPPLSGFFFGLIEIDEYYWENLEDTVNILEAALKSDNGVFYYQADW